MAVPNSQTLDFDHIATTTLRNYLSTQLHDNIFDKLTLFAWLKGKNRYKPADGGEYLVEPLLYGTNSTAKSFSGFDTIDTTQQDGITAATFNWKGEAVSIVISEEEKMKNSGKSKIISLLEAKTFQAEESLRSEMNTQAFSDGTGNGSKDLTGLRAMVKDTGTYGNIDRATYTWWKSKLRSTTEALSVAQMRSLYNQAGARASFPDFIITTRAIYEAYEALAYGKMEIQSPKDQGGLADLGFDVLRFKGAMITWDEDCPASHMFFLNSNYVNLRYHPDFNFKVTEKKQPTNQLAWAWQVYWFGNLTTGNCRRLAVHTGLND